MNLSIMISDGYIVCCVNNLWICLLVVFVDILAEFVPPCVGTLTLESDSTITNNSKATKQMLMLVMIS